MTTQALGPIERTYHRYGFPKFTINTLIDESKSQAKIDEYKEQKARSDAQLAQQAVEAIQKQNENDNKSQRKRNSYC